MKNQSTNQQPQDNQIKAENDFLKMIAVPGLIRKKDTQEDIPKEVRKETKTASTKVTANVSSQKSSPKKKASVKSKHQIKTADKVSKIQTEKSLMTVRVNPQLFQLVKFKFQPQTKASYKIINEILRYWLEQEHPDMLHLIPKED